ncbi:hypothetical protein JF634_11355 [Simonsiella muelleri]|uniref:Uncharacterized protein n=1 Tax=Simonsiella muelleri ATCC 29453 TaxID=641147 RepID=V9HJT9_9NEIS|nr:hypothetical protein [Simonsiella muelleri]AUX61662.1 hypothetical protein BWP33_07520 [Simonsiella muelleri ATCC 29453]EFG29930.1 hypothetical protein HMPREF9021_02249 [Simonsiella muelleri ATCC 29453]UBQ53733.1 hypothetical protein JF634_11355 [Simonsiella muelleri]
MATQEIKEYFSGQGRVKLAPYFGGVVKKHKARWIGNVPSLELETELETDEHLESHTGTRSADRVREKSRKVKFKMTLEDFASANLAIAFQASLTNVPKGNVADLTSADDLAVGDSWQLGKIKVSDVVLTDSTASSPKTLQAGVNYRIDERFGMVDVLDLSGLKLPLKASFKHDSADVLGLMLEKAEGYYLVFEGLNTAESDKPVLVEIHKAAISPAKTLALINTDLASFDLEGTALMSDGNMVTVTK